MGLFQTEHFLLFLSQIQSELAGGTTYCLSGHYSWLVHCWVLLHRGRNRCFLAAKGYMAGRERKREQKHQKLKKISKGRQQQQPLVQYSWLQGWRTPSSQGKAASWWCPKCWIWNPGHLHLRLFKHIYQGVKQVKQQSQNCLHSSNIQPKC